MTGCGPDAHAITETSSGVHEHGFWRAPIATVVLDADGRILASNAATEQLLGRSASELSRQPFTEVIDPNERPDFAFALATAALGADHGRSGRIWTALGAIASLRTTIHFGPVGDGSVVAQLVPVTRDEVAGASLAEQRAFRTALIELSELSHAQIDDTEFFSTLMQRAIEVVPGSQAGSIMLRRPSADEFDFVAAQGFDLERLREQPLRYSEMFRDTVNPSAMVHVRPADAIREIQASGTIDPQRVEWMFTVGRLLEIESSVSVPVQTKGETIAFISLDNFEDSSAFDVTSVEMTTLLGRVIADLLRRRDLEAELRRERESYRHLALHDELTGLPNRRQLESVLAESVARSQRLQRPIAALFIDIDDFKRLNDEHGHDIGDLAIAAVAEGLEHGVRSGDVVGRWGGNEFLMIAPGAPSSQVAYEIGQRVVNRFDGRLPLSDGSSVECRISVGVAWSSDGAEGADALVQRADDALYDAKRAGKATLTIASE